MNCYDAHHLLSAERDGPLATDQQSALETHLRDCLGCRKARPLMAASIATWRDSTEAIKVPDVDRAWQDIRRVIRTGDPVKSRGSVKALRWVAPFGLAAALAIVASVTPRWQNHVQAAQVAPRMIAHADFVDVPLNASSMVYVDDQSGWLVVWSDSGPQPTGG